MHNRGNVPRRVQRLAAIAAIISLIAVGCDPGHITTMAGTGTSGYTGDGGAATAATLNDPSSLVAIPGGGFYVLDQSGCVIRKVDASGTITTIAGTGSCGYSGDGGPATAAKIDSRSILSGPTGQLALDVGGNLYLADSGNYRVRRISPDGTITTIAGDGHVDFATGSVVPDACVGTSVAAHGIAVGPDGTVYVACDSLIGKILPDGSFGQVYDAGTVGIAALAADSAGDLFFSTFDGVVHERTPDGTVSTYTDVNAQFGAPDSPTVQVSDLTIAPDGTVYAALGPVSKASFDWLDPWFKCPDGCWMIGSTNFNRYNTWEYVLRLGPGSATRIAGTGYPDQGTLQTGYGPQLDLTPTGIAIAADGGLLIASGHVVYRLDDPANAAPWKGGACAPAEVHPGGDVSGADLSGLNFTDCDFTGMNLTGANFTGADLTGARGTGIVGTPAALPTGWTVISGVLFGPGTNLDNLDLTGLDLHGQDLSGAHLWHTNFTGADLTGANLTGADLIQVDFHSANLTGANLTQQITHSAQYGATADFTDANLSSAHLGPSMFTYPTSPGAGYKHLVFTGANLDGTDLRRLDAVGGVVSGGVTGTPLLPAHWGFAGGYLFAPYSDFSGIDLTGVDLSGFTLDGDNLTDANLTDANLADATFINTNVTGTTFTGATATSITAVGLIGTPASTPTGLVFRSNGTIGALLGPGVKLANTGGAYSVDLRGFDLSGLDLTGATFYTVHLDGANLANTILTGVRSSSNTGTPSALPTNWQFISGCFIGKGAVLTNQTFGYSDLTGADLEDADLTGASLRYSTLTGANLNGTNLTGANLTGAVSGSITGTPAALPTNWQLVGGYLIGPGADLRSADLNNANLRGANLAKLDLSGADLSSADLTGANLNYANLTDVNLTGADLTNASLRAATVTGSDLTGANLTGAHLDGAVSGSITGTPAALPTDWQLVDGYLIGPGADLGGADLENANLRGANLYGASLSLANLSYADLTNADLTYAWIDHATANHATITGANFTGVNFTRLRAGALIGTPAALPTNWALRGGFLVGPNGYLTGFGMTGVDLSGLDLTGADLSHSNLTNTNLLGTILASTNLTSAKFTGATGTPTGGSSATYSATTCPDASSATSPATCVGHGFAN